jgi:hypothetical protein
LVRRQCSNSATKPTTAPNISRSTRAKVRIGTIYKTSGNPSGNSWFCGLNGVQNGPGPFNGFVRTLEDAKAAFAASWGGWLKAADLSENTATPQLKDSDSGGA